MKKTFAVLGIVLSIFGLFLLAAFFAYLGVTAGVRLDPQKLTLQTEHIRMFDASGTEIEAANRNADVPYEAFPEYLPDAFVAVEDKRFYHHNGFDLRGIARAALKNIASFSFREGASTISQQLIKNTHLTSEKTFSRKLKEFKLTRILEKKYSKEEILELYLNSIYFGHSAFGIAGAARFYFGKTPETLTPGECALLAALVKSPNRYSPFKNPQKCLARRNFVLSLMKDQGYLDQAQYSAALAEPLPSAPAESKSGNAYFALVYDEIEELFPDVKSSYLTSMRVYTAYDPALQSVLEETQAESGITLAVRGAQENLLKAYHSTVGSPKRLPASTIKPLLVYGPALEEDYISPATPILDERTDFAGYCPDDADGASDTYMSVRYALSHSVNIPAVKILNSMGIERGAAYLERMGLHVPREDYSLALALGGMREGFTLRQLADGYAVLAKGGTYAPSGTIRRIEDGRGRVIYQRGADEKRVFSQETCFLLNDMLNTAAKTGTAKKLSGLPFPVSAKTGTAEGKKGNLDAYTIAYTPQDVVAVWMGNADNSAVRATGGGLPANHAMRILETLYARSAPSAFTPPAGVERIAYDRSEYESGHKIVLADPAAPITEKIDDYFKRSQLPKEKCTKYSLPTIKTPEISVNNGSVSIVLCQAEYYDYIIKRENRGQITTVYRGKFQKTICDNSVCAGESYLYTVIPVYHGNEGTPVVLPRIRIEGRQQLPENWWDD